MFTPRNAPPTLSPYHSFLGLGFQEGRHHESAHQESLGFG